MKIYNVGDSVYAASFDLRQESIPCPVCYGKLNVTLILGNGESVVFPCNFCGKGYDAPLGYITEYIRKPRCKLVTISGKGSREDENGVKIEYRTLDSYCLSPEDVFETQEEAMIEAQKLADIQGEEEKTRAIYLKKDKMKSYSWNVGYHLREAKRLREQIAYHERMATACKERAKP